VINEWKTYGYTLRFKSGMQTSSSPQFLKMIMVSFLDGGEFKSRTGVRMERGSRGSCCRYAGAKSASSLIQYLASTTRLVNLSRMSLCRIIFVQLFHTTESEELTLTYTSTGSAHLISTPLYRVIVVFFLF
jgi:hypothetical protein